MVFEFPAIRTRVNALLQDDANFITVAERDEAINQAVLVVDTDKPDLLIKDITGDGTLDYDIESEGYERGPLFVQRTVEFPAGENPPIFPDEGDDWFIYEDPSKPSGQQQRLRFTGLTPLATDTIRFTFDAPHAVTETASTLTRVSFSGVVFKTLELLYKALASRFAETTDPTIEADAVDYGGRSQNFLFLAERAKGSYDKVIGFDSETQVAAQALAEHDIIFPWGEDFLFHPRRQR